MQQCYFLVLNYLLHVLHALQQFQSLNEKSRKLLKKEDQDVYFNLIHFMVQLNLSATAILGKEESGHCREVEMRVNVWTVRQKKMTVVKRWPFCGGGHL